MAGVRPHSLSSRSDGGPPRLLRGISTTTAMMTIGTARHNTPRIARMIISGTPSPKKPCMGRSLARDGDRADMLVVRGGGRKAAGSRQAELLQPAEQGRSRHAQGARRLGLV